MAEEVIENSLDEFSSEFIPASTDELISLLQFTQKNEGFISPQSVQKIACDLRISAARVYAVASFYAQFRFHKPGQTSVRVCLGTACHVQGGRELSLEIQSLLGIHAGETTPDGRFDFEEVACLGCCAQAAVVEVNGKIYAKMSRDRLREVLEEHGRA